jgi:hypothetical protein
MTNLGVETRETRAGTTRGDLGVVAGALVAAVVTWALWTEAAGITLAAEGRDVGLGAVIVTTLLVSAAGVGLARVLGRRTAGVRTWTFVAAGVWVLSLLGPLGATTTSAVVALASLHLVVGAVVLFGVRRVHDDD